MKSIITFGALTVLSSLLGFLLGLLSYSLWRLLSPLTSLISVAGLVLWVLLMVKAYQGQRFKLPIAGQMAEQWLSSYGQKEEAQAAGGSGNHGHGPAS